jgi:serine/threonine protein kinase
MTPEQIDRVFGRGRLKMVTGDHVEVFREAAAEGDRRRYTKRFLDTRDGDFGQWTEREWRILARLIGHGIDCVPEVVQFDRGAQGGPQLVQTYDAGATVDQWATILPVARESCALRHVFEDCAHWWALAHHCLRALSAIHELSVVHLDIKGDNVCIPVSPATFDPNVKGLRLAPRFESLALIDFAFSLISRERLSTALPIGWQTEYDYQSPRLLQALEAGRRGDLQPTRELDWRCDVYSLAAMLRRYLPAEDRMVDLDGAAGWTAERASAAKDLILALRDAHDREATQARPYPALMAMTSARLAEAGMEASLAAGWCLARDADVTPVAASPITPLTRLAPPLRIMVSPRAVPQRRRAQAPPPAVLRRRTAEVEAPPRSGKRRAAVVAALVVLAAAGVAAMMAPMILSRLAWPGEDTPPPVAQREEPATSEAPPPELPPGATAQAAEAPPAPAPATRATARTVPPRAATPPTNKRAPKATTKVALQPQAAPVRIRFHQEPPTPASPPAAAPATSAPDAAPATSAPLEHTTPPPAKRAAASRPETTDNPEPTAKP